ncbi:peptidase inhibitor family I36 protein [uncultured Nostoc sp.]
MKIAAGMKVTFYSDINFGGQSKTFTADTPYVGDDFNDKTSSIVIELV